jgi:hypothetical protein
MTQDEIIEMARQSSFSPHWEFEKCLVCNPDSLCHFAKLVAEKEREACAKVCEEMSNTQANMNVAWRNGCREVATEIRERRLA